MSPQASVQTNYIRFDYFPLQRVTQQDCPLSRSPLSIALRSSPLFKGIQHKQIECKVSLYADHLLLYVSDLVASLPAILSILDNFSSFSEYK